jgi:subtilisin family serine protease
MCHQASNQNIPITTYKMKSSLTCPLTECSSSISKDIINKNLPFGVRLTGGQKLRNAGLTGVGVRVAIIDSGIDSNHPGFNGRIAKQTWLRKGPLNDHGTHIAGTVHMMAPDADIYDYRVYGRKGIDVDKAIVQAIKQACDDECNVINLSLCLEGDYIHPTIHHQIQDAHEKGVIVVCSSSRKESTDPLINSTWYVYDITFTSSRPSFMVSHVSMFASLTKTALP